MSSVRLGITAKPMVVAAALLGLFLAGCDQHVQIIRDHTIKIAKHATWAWRPAEPPREAARDSGRSDRPVVSRDVIGRGGQPVRQENDPAAEIERREVRAELEQQLTAKGLTQVADPAAADFLVDYHFAVRHGTATVPYAYGGYYPGLVCGPFGCWGGWGYGPGYVGYERVHFREGTFVFDFVTRGNQLAYRAIGEEPIHKAQFSHDQIHDMVHALLKDLKTVG